MSQSLEQVEGDDRVAACKDNKKMDGRKARSGQYQFWRHGDTADATAIVRKDVATTSEHAEVKVKGTSYAMYQNIISVWIAPADMCIAEQRTI
ncbi:hypothetical protein LTR17_020067 [Elasticomyces elasticus]|nr:hypothetical protein LTR17_020067 [Elasticomyces elasticus]